MGIVKSTIYSTTASEAMTRLEFSTDFQGQTASVTISLVKAAAVVKTETYQLDADNLIAKVIFGTSDISTDATITLAANAVVFSGVCVWKDVTSFSATNVAVAYR